MYLDLNNNFGVSFSVWCLAALAFIGYTFYYLLYVVQRPIIACGQGKFRIFLEENVPVLREKYWPTFWCIEPRLQTVFAYHSRELIIPKQPYRREVIHLSDGGQVALDWREDNIPRGAPVLIAVPGLTGSSDVEYMRNIAMTVHKEGIRCVIFNNRGLGGIPLKTAKGYCAVDVNDLDEVIQHVKKCHPHSAIAILGVSVGGLLVGNYLATKQQESRTLATAVLLAPPWNVFVANENIEQSVLNSVIAWTLTRCLVDGFSNSKKLWENKMDEKCVLSSRTIREFDTNFTVKAFGFKDISDYYSKASIHEKLAAFPIPTLCLSAADDPFQPFHGIPVDGANKCKNVAIIVPSRGGHLGFMEGFFPVSSKQYMQRVIGQYLRSILHGDNYRNF